MAQAPSPQEAPGWYDFVTDFDHTYDQFATNWQALLALAPFIQDHPNLQPEYDYWINRGGKDMQTLQNLKATRDRAAGWLNWLQSGAKGVFNWIGETTGLYGLGIAPLVLISLGAAAGALATVIADLPGIINFAQRSNLTMQLSHEGKYTPEQIAAMVNDTIPPQKSMLGSIESILQLAVIGAALYFFAPAILKALSRGK
jgi:hypothetical protein